MSELQYIGARYVPLFADPIEWQNNIAYEPLTIVTRFGNSYTSKKAVPAGFPPENSAEYWAVTGNYNAQVEQYRQAVAKIETDVSGIDAILTPLSLDVENLKKGSYITPEMFGAIGDGIADDTVPVQSANDAARNQNKILILQKSYAVGELNIDCTSVFGSGGALANLICNKPCTNFITRKNIARSVFCGVFIDGRGVCDTALNIDYTLQTGPSLNSVYDNVKIRGYKQYGIHADNNNDVWFYNCAIIERETPTAVSFYSSAPGGPVCLVNCNTVGGGAVEISAQNISLFNDVVSGLHIIGNGWNMCTLYGGYYFGDDSNNNFSFNGNCWGFAAYGCHVENAGGAIFAGSEKFAGSEIRLENCHVFKSTAADVNLLSTNIPTPFYMTNIVIQGGRFDIVKNNPSPALFKISVNNLPNEATKNYTGKQYTYNNNVRLPANSDTNVDIGLTSTNLCGLIFVCGQPDAPASIYSVMQTGGYGETVTKISEADGIGGLAGSKAEVTAITASGITIKNTGSADFTANVTFIGCAFT